MNQIPTTGRTLLPAKARIRALISCAFVAVSFACLAAETLTDTSATDVIGYAWLKKDILIPVPSDTKFVWLRSGQQYPKIGEIETGYLMLVETKDGRKRPALVPFRDRMGNSTERGYYVGIEEAKPGFFPLKAGERFPVLSQASGKYVVRYATNDCNEVLAVAETDVEFVSRSEVNKAIESIVAELKAKAERQLAEGNYDGEKIEAIFSKYTGRFAEDSVKMRQELAAEYRFRVTQALREQRREFAEEQRAKGLVEFRGEWVTPQEVERRKEAAKAEEERRQRLEAEERALTRIKLERGFWGGYKAEYEFVLLKNLFNTGISKWDAGGNVEIYVRGADIVGLSFWNRHSPENREKKYKGQFPGQGTFEISENDVAMLSGYLKKFLEWDAAADREGLKGVTKDIGVLGEYQLSYHRSDLSQGWCTVIRKLEDTKDFEKVRESNITLFPPAAITTLQLLDLRGKLREEKAARKSAEEDMKEKANSILK